MLQKLEKEIDDVDAKIGDRWRLLDRFAYFCFQNCGDCGGFMSNTLWNCTWKFLQATPEEVFLKISLISVLVAVQNMSLVMCIALHLTKSSE